MRQSSWMNPAVEVQVIFTFGLPVSSAPNVGFPAKKSSSGQEPPAQSVGPGVPPPKKKILPRWSWASESASMCANSPPNFKACLPSRYETLSCKSQYGLGNASKGRPPWLPNNWPACELKPPTVIVGNPPMAAPVLIG